MKFTLLAGALLLAASAAPAVAGPPKHPWCAKLDRMAQASVDEGGKFKYNSDADDVSDDWGLYSVAVASCGGMSSDHPEYDKPLADARHRWERRLGISEAEWADVIEWTNEPQSSRMDPVHLDMDLAKQTLETLSPGQQYGLIQSMIHFGTEMVRQGEPLYWADALGDKISATARLAYLNECLHSDNAVVWAACQPDIDAFDPKAVFKEMSVEKELSADRKIQVRIVADKMAREWIPKHREKVAKLVKGDPGYAKMFEISAQVAKDFAKLYAANDAAVALALRMDDARIMNSKKAYDGCEAVTRKEFQTAVSEIPAKRFNKIKDQPNDLKWFADSALPIALSYPRVYLSALAYVQCSAEDDAANPQFADMLEKLMVRWPGERGPRSAAMSAIVAAGIELDDRDAEVKGPDLDREWLGEGVGVGFIHHGKAREKKTHGSRSTGGVGAIAKTAKSGDFVDIDFVPVPGSEEACASGHFTHQIEAIRSDGTIQRHYECAKYVMVKINKASPPAAVDAVWAGPVKGGMFGSIGAGVVMAAWASAKSDAPSIVFGAPVK